MRAIAAVALSALVVVAGAAVPLVGAAQTGTSSDAPGTTAGDAEEGSTTAPGEQFAGVVGVQGAEVEGEVATRRLETRLERAATADERARIVAETTNDTGERLEALRERRERLEAAHENGTLSDGQYRARLARLAAELRTVERVANRSAAASESLPAAALEANGVDRSRIEELRRNASELGGGAVAEAAREIGGPSAASNRRGPPDADDERDEESGDGAGEDRANGSAGGNASTGDDAAVDDSDRGPRDGEGGDGSNGGADGEERTDGPEATTETRERGDGSNDDGATDGSDEAGGDTADGSDGTSDGTPERSDGSGSDGRDSQRSDDGSGEAGAPA